ncbi:MAG: succinate dehydrogenase assembly factor 2 [Micavibrio aeruginosavorus]|uniref:FAD assembly factor SdhE n=1 Tax=Micavibrio aeruginosavorus TaxID=349221 RepID=A0A2W5N634_9BACT|nr:MAG: succinate dehydrogenase assembly factor 2 [Micavibrio aeruginosavorus]
MSISMTLEELDNRRKRLIFRSWHRGTREMDLIMGTFAETHVPSMDVVALDMYEELLHTPDPDVYDWLSGQKPVPANMINPVLEKLLCHDYAKHRAAKDDASA